MSRRKCANLSNVLPAFFMKELSRGGRGNFSRVRSLKMGDEKNGVKKMPAVNHDYYAAGFKFLSPSSGRLKLSRKKIDITRKST